MIRTINNISEKKQKLIEEYCSKEFTVGESVYIKNKYISNVSRSPENTTLSKILKINGNHVHLNHENRIIKDVDISKLIKNTNSIGENPFNEKYTRVQFVAYQLESIIFNLDLSSERNREYEFNGIFANELNWNPFVYNKNNKKEYYQRDFVWTIEDNQLLIESIYNDIDCGKILVRKRSWKELEILRSNGETEIAFKDIIDGKQRLNAIRGFIMNEYPDLRGNYFSDLSVRAQQRFGDNQLLSYGELPENSEDKQIIAQFLKLNFTGIPQSTEHIKYVSDIYEKL